MGKGAETRERILEIAEESVLAKGFGATSIEEIIAEAGITKSGFFYHFRDKNELARGLLERHNQQNDQLIEESFGRAGQLSDDPLQRLLVGLTLLAERMSGLTGGHPGCIVASMTYQDRLFSREVRDMVTRSVKAWNSHFRGMLEDIVAVYQPREPVDIEQVARMICCAIDGGIIMSKSLDNPSVLPEQLLMTRSYVKLLFSPVAGAAATQPEAVAA